MYNSVSREKKGKGEGNVPCTLHACGTDRVCTTVDDEPVRREHAGADREEPNGAFKAGWACGLNKERGAVVVVGMWLAKQDRCATEVRCVL